MENPVSESTPTPVQILEPKTKFPFMYIVLSLLILVLLSFTVFLYYQNRQLKNKLANYQTQPSPTPIITNPNTGDLFQDIKVRMKELLP